MAYATHPHSMVPGKRQDYQYPKRCLVATAMSLRDHLLNTPSECSFSDLTIVDENWYIDKLSRIFTVEAISHIFSVKSSNPTDINDTIIWRWNKQNKFKIDSAYSRIVHNTWEEKHPIWDHIWKIQIPQRIRLFLWLAYRECLMTNNERVCCSFGSSASCPRCLSDMESTIHALHDCKEAKEIPYSVAQRSLTWARYYADCSTPTPPRQTQRANRTGWPCTCSGWTSINVDGAVHSNTSMVSIGGLARNNNGNWIMGFYQS
ncbi:hypothetical protein V6N11_054710 [Hibiscus sabdariffa]|uniref:Reverse transcriptase zinc-binding domain-containing protein n=1 Tax=Hibiscus sabdariffa TaxID=183260 RepID=A0ABR2S4N9_9ROSI